MRTKIIAGNWKMNTSLADAHVLANGVRNQAEHIERIQIVLCPPSVWLASLAHDEVPRRKLAHLHLGAQNMHWEEAGAFTGEISPAMVKEVAEYVLVGHSERTHLFGEGPEIVTEKLHAAFHAGLSPILCIGEDAQKEGSKKQLVHALNHLVKGLSQEQIDRLIVAYEPVWAIGSGNPATPEYAQDVMTALRSVLSPKTRILYGGSVNEENAAGFLQQPDCDGLLIGGTSLKLKPFLTICQLADDLAGHGGHRSLHS